jgi:tubulin--tyrosine ligase
MLQPLPNAFELFGVDFLVSHTPNASPNPFHVKILEINSEPAIELTGPRLNWILVDLFDAIANVCVEPFFAEPKSGQNSCDMTETQHHLLKCLDEKLRPS